MASCSDIVDLALYLGLYRASLHMAREFEGKSDTMKWGWSYPEGQKYINKGEHYVENAASYKKMADRLYDKLVKQCGDPPLPAHLRRLVDMEGPSPSDSVWEFGDLVSPWLASLSSQCGCKCEAEGGKPIKDYAQRSAEAVTTFALMQEAEKLTSEEGG